MLLSEAIKEIFSHVTDEFVITSTGHISREAFVYDRPRNFYMQGSMGCALAIGLGVALNSNANVIVIAGDGATLMSLGTLALLDSLTLPNLRLVILDNNCHGSTGGQKTCSDTWDFQNELTGLPEVMEIEYSKSTAPRITIPCREIARRFKCELSQVAKANL